MRPASVGFQCPECVREGQGNQRVARTVYGGRYHQPVGRTGRFGLITTILIIANAVMFAITTAAAGTLSLTGDETTSSFALRLSLIPPAVAHGEWYRLVTTMFMHANLLHIAFNMWALVIVGPPLEAVLGRIRYLALYFLAGIGGSILTLIGSPPATRAVGASGAIFGLFAAFYIVARDRGWQTGGILLTIGLNLALSFSLSTVIDWRGHVGGLIVGAAVTAVYAYAPRGPQQVRLQALGVGAIAVILAALGFVGARHMHEACRNPTNQQDYAYCQIYDPGSVSTGLRGVAGAAGPAVTPR
jgi:membrane associated rhomboid family serine protease